MQTQLKRGRAVCTLTGISPPPPHRVDLNESAPQMKDWWETCRLIDDWESLISGSAPNMSYNSADYNRRLDADLRATQGTNQDRCVCVCVCGYNLALTYKCVWQSEGLCLQQTDRYGLALTPGPRLYTALVHVTVTQFRTGPTEEACISTVVSSIQVLHKLVFYMRHLSYMKQT